MAREYLQDLNRVEGRKKELKNKGKGKVTNENDKNKNIEEQLDGKTGVSIVQTDGNIQSALIQPLDMQLINSFNELEITEERLPEVRIEINSTNLEDDTIGTGGNDDQIIKKNKGKGKGKGKGKKKKQQQPRKVESSVDLKGSGSGKQDENEDDTLDDNYLGQWGKLCHPSFF
jgi:hypothetical protein